MKTICYSCMSDQMFQMFGQGDYGKVVEAERDYADSLADGETVTCKHCDGVFKYVKNEKGRFEQKLVSPTGGSQ